MKYKVQAKKMGSGSLAYEGKFQKHRLSNSTRIQSMMVWGVGMRTKRLEKSVALDGILTFGMVVGLWGAEKGKMMFLCPVDEGREWMKRCHVERFSWIRIMQIWIFLGGMPLTLRCQINEMLLRMSLQGFSVICGPWIFLFLLSGFLQLNVMFNKEVGKALEGQEGGPGTIWERAVFDSRGGLFSWLRGFFLGPQNGWREESGHDQEKP